MNTIANESKLQPLLNKRALAEYLGMSVRGVEGLMYAGRIPFYTLGHRTVRFNIQEVLNALKRFETLAQP